MVKSMHLCNPALVLRLTLLSLLLLTGQQVAHAKEVVMLTADPIDQQGQPLPMELASKLFDFIAREENLQIQQQRSPWPRAMRAAENGEGVLYGVSKTREREKIFHFSLPVQSKYMFLVTRSDAQFPFNTMADLKGKTIGIQRGFSYGDQFDALKDNLFKVEVDNHAPLSRIYKLLFRRMDAGLFSALRKDPRFLERRLQALRDDNEGGNSTFADVRLTVLPKPLLIDTTHFAVRADKDDGIIDKLNVAILKARKAGLIEEFH
ncbi:substrate-binding periplasmic protein [Undibacterium sp. JH2W]|uniref:substrate-binding periplasmic protein n=1 Tax=Undibacterium sp. JH2W TaxID=3413037 RepID=UPI003BEF8539